MLLISSRLEARQFLWAKGKRQVIFDFAIRHTPAYLHAPSTGAFPCDRRDNQYQLLLKKFKSNPLNQS
jgi:hypothetical protein